MRKVFRFATATVAATLIAGCSGVPVNLGTRSAGPTPQGEARNISAEACGFQLFLFIPISINNRLERAYQELEAQAAGDFIADVEIRERWVYGFVGTRYCTYLQAKAIRPK